MDTRSKPSSQPIRTIGSLLLVLLLIWIMMGCSEQKPVKIGFVGGLSGRVADLGISGRDGAILAVEYWNQKGGVNGRPIQLLVRDDQQNAETARKMVTELLDEGVEAIIGHMTSSMSVATVPIVNAARIPMISPTSTTTDLEGLDDYFFRVLATTTRYAHINAVYQFKVLGSRRIAAVIDTSNLAYTEGWFNDFKDTFESLGGEIIYRSEFHSSTETNLALIAEKALMLEPDTILIVANSLDVALLCQQIRKLNSEVGLAASEWAATERLIELGGRAVEGISIAQFFDRNNQSPQYLDFKIRHMDRFAREPGFPSMAGYDATQVTLSALSMNSHNDLKQDILSFGTYDGVQGGIEIDQFGDSSRRTFLTTVQDSRFEVVE